MVRPALLGTSNLTSPAGPSNPRLAETSVLARATRTGAERARRYRFNSIKSLRLCRIGERHEPRSGDLTICLKRRRSERDRWYQKRGNHKTMALHRTPAGLDLYFTPTNPGNPGNSLMEET